jgi:hypothetical protein
LVEDLICSYTYLLLNSAIHILLCLCKGDPSPFFLSALDRHSCKDNPTHAYLAVAQAARGKGGENQETACSWRLKTVKAVFGGAVERTPKIVTRDTVSVALL